MRAKMLFLLMTFICASHIQAQMKVLSYNSTTKVLESALCSTSAQVWDTLRVDVEMEKRVGFKFGFYLGYVDASHYQYLNITPFENQLIVDLGKFQNGVDRMAEQFVYDKTISEKTRYRLLINRAPWVDVEHWRPWKVQIINLSTNEVVFKSAVENSMPFFGFGKVGFYTNEPGLKVFDYQLLTDSNQHDELIPAPYFSDGMILPRNKAFPVWGIAPSGQLVSVTFNSKTRETVADASGYWKVEMPSTASGVGYEMSIRSGNEHVHLKDIAVGEVWLASGQSNMEMRAWQSDVTKQVQSKDVDPTVRVFMQQQWPSDKEIEVPAGKWLKGGQLTIMGVSAAALSFAVALQKELGIPVGIIQAAWGGTGIESWISRKGLEAEPVAVNLLKRYTDFGALIERGTLVDASWPFVWDLPGQHHAPSYLFNGMVHPYTQIPIAGILWYQGESNAHRASQYEALLSTYLKDMRSQWNNPQLPLIAVQLAGYDGRLSGNEVEGAWPLIRESQRKVLHNDKYAGLVSAFDLGDSLDIHPYKKWEIGQRMAAAALHIKYKGKQVFYSGPLYEKIVYNRNKAIVYFRKGTANFEQNIPEYCGFMVAGADKVFKPAKAFLRKNGRIELHSDEVIEIEAVRYGWENYPVQSLLKNKQGIAAVPFRTDDWPIKDQYDY